VHRIVACTDVEMPSVLEVATIDEAFGSELGVDAMAGPLACRPESLHPGASVSTAATATAEELQRIADKDGAGLTYNSQTAPRCLRGRRLASPGTRSSPRGDRSSDPY